MPRYILIDNHSGYIFGDSDNFAGSTVLGDLTPILAARMFDESTGEYGRAYENVNQLAANETGYLIYRIDDGIKTVPGIFDGQDPQLIAAIDRNCPHVATIRAYREITDND